MKRQSIYHIALTAMLAAMTMAIILYASMPWGYGRIHFGDAVILLAAVLLPTPYAMAVGAIGGGMANLLGDAVMWAPATVVIKAAITMPFAKQDKMINRRNLLALLPYAVITLVGYGLYQWLLISLGSISAPDGVWVAITANLIGDTVQITGSSALFIALAKMLEKIKFKQRLGL